MRKPKPIYNESFHTRRIGHRRYPVMAGGALESFAVAFPDGGFLREVVDVGCSIGAMLGAIQAITPCRCAGIDHDVPDEPRGVFTGLRIECDLNNPDPSAFKDVNADLVICQEVMEHVEPENTGVSLDVLAACAADESLLVFSGAAIGQGGRHHVNCRSKEDWIGLLEERGWNKHDQATSTYLRSLWEGEMRQGCYVNNTVCLTRGGANA